MIKKVDEIPQTLQEKRESYREMIRSDIAYAWEHGIRCFEFEGDYNWKYLGNYAREEANRFTGKLILKRGKEVLHEEYPDFHPRWNPFNLYGSERKDRALFKVSNKKAPDRIHVYMELYPEKLDDVCRYCIEKERSADERRQARDRERAAGSSKADQSRQ